MNDNDRYVIRAGETAEGPFDTVVTAARAGWEFCSLRIAALAEGETVEVDTGVTELLVLPLSGAATVIVDGVSYELAGRESVFSDITDYLFIPRGKSFRLTATRSGRFALPAAVASKDLPVRHCPRTDVKTGIRGSGIMTRQVNNYALGNAVETSRLLVCEVLTPGGNWSSYPPHKHDEHSEVERELEEIYYFEVREGGPGGSTEGFGLQRVYSSAKSIDVCAEVRSGDTVLVPWGYHGPSVAAPGHDLYYLNVMGGPAEDATWLMTDDPCHTWQRETWHEGDIDPRVPFTALNEEN
ncbi:5-deoxy-glucuronate isomerase [Flaviflexus salsibiostraticola]|uniref:5-deoxy-glucuronate isomerase n=1 Tax=Flaviflexus salsibiostraticola TaxID=1282737 RepID=A0A3Q8WST7_9ACTO|nr:5-deoxy-glucuronate isomerase [Flaviflexus salsibiostraticola]AZN29471.1 5-deoxy-glucuronate isomerase [Flaviflexus salsibiostraticola]